MFSAESLKLGLGLASLILLAGSIPSCNGANILFFIGFGGPSHEIAMSPLAEALAAKGHTITFVLQYQPKHSHHPNISYYCPEQLVKYFTEMMSSDNDAFDPYQIRADGQNSLSWFFFPSFGITVCEQLYTDPTFLAWVEDEKNKFDLVIVDALLNECAYGIAHRHKAKHMAFSISTVLPMSIEAYGLPDESSSIPDVTFYFPQDMNFFQRVVSAVLPLYWKAYREWYFLPKLTEITRKAFGDEEFPDYVDLEKNTSLVLVNTHPSQEFPRSLPPHVIPVGGISWVDKKKPLEKKFEDFINKGKEGFIYISFGSFVDFLSFPEEIQKTFLNALKRFPNIQFIWKLNKVPDNLPEHILIDKWMPQQDLLLHPKIKAFITHSGLGGVNEAIFSSVPMICFPVFAEQDYNARLVEAKGFGINMEITTLTEDAMVKAIQAITSDDSYRRNMNKISQLFQDRPMKPLETAVWWTEYVLRHENTDFLRPSCIDQAWWKKRQLDVWVTLLLVPVLFFALFILTICKVVKMCCGGKSGSNKVSRKKVKKN